MEPLGFSLDAKQVRRAGLDYWPRVQPRIWPRWSALEPELAGLGEAYFISPNAERTIWDTPFAPKSVLVFGKETDGLPAALRKQYPEALRSIPMVDKSLRSLNLSTAVGIVVYEVLRQRSL